MAEYEAKLISERTKAAMTAAKVRGREFGGMRGSHLYRFSAAARSARNRVERERAKARALDFDPLLCALRDRGETIYGIAAQLTLMGIETPRGKGVWHSDTVRQMFEYAGERVPKFRCNRRSPSTRLGDAL